MNPERPRVPAWLAVLSLLVGLAVLLGGCLCGGFWWLDWFIGRQ